MTKTDAYQQGKRAGFKARQSNYTRITTNPHDPEDHACIEWRLGYRDGEREAIRKEKQS